MAEKKCPPTIPIDSFKEVGPHREFHLTHNLQYVLYIQYRHTLHTRIRIDTQSICPLLNVNQNLSDFINPSFMCIFLFYWWYINKHTNTRRYGLRLLFKFFSFLYIWNSTYIPCVYILCVWQKFNTTAKMQPK